MIEREKIILWKYDGEYGLPKDVWFAAIGGVHGWDDGSIVGAFEQKGSKPLIAAMRAYVASKFGDEVEDTA
ncbi:phage protein NinX family protein [Paraburkholderia sp. 2C]